MAAAKQMEQLKLERIIAEFKDFKKGENKELSPEDYEMMQQISFAYDINMEHGFTKTQRELWKMIMDEFSISETTAKNRFFQAKQVSAAQFKIGKTIIRQFQYEFLLDMQIRANNLALKLMEEKPELSIKAMDLIEKISKNISEMFNLDKADETLVDPEAFMPHTYYFTTNPEALKDANGKPIPSEKLKMIDEGINSLVKQLGRNTNITEAEIVQDGE